jgi:hypothetical protein
LDVQHQLVEEKVVVLQVLPLSEDLVVVQV